MIKKKVAVLYSGGKYFGGIENYIYNLFLYNSSKDIELILLSLGEWELTEKLKRKSRVVQVFPSARFRLKTIFEIKKFLKENKINLLITNGTVSDAYGRAVSYLSDVKNISTVHSDPYHDYANPSIRFLYKMVFMATKSQTTKFIAVSNGIKKMLIDSGVKANKIEVIYNGVAIPKQSHKKTKNKDLVIGSLGRLHHVKGFHNLLMAISQVESVSLKIAGNGPELWSLKNLSKKLNISSRVEFIGFVADVDDFFSSIDIYVQPSLSEGFGLSVVEAMLAKKPVIVTPAGSLKEIVRDGETGIVTSGLTPTEIASSIETLIGNKKLCDKISQEGYRDAVKNFSIKAWIESTVMAYKNVLS